MVLQEATPQPQGDASPQAEVSEHVRKLVGKLDQWRGCMSYNARYFGEPIGLVKSTVADLARSVDPIYPPKPEPAVSAEIHVTTVPIATPSAHAPAPPVACGAGVRAVVAQAHPAVVGGET